MTPPSLSPKKMPTRVCSVCRRRYPLARFVTGPAIRGRSRHGYTCEFCRDEQDHTSPFAVAAEEVERAFGMPVSEWMPHITHPLTVLHYAIMVRLHNEQPGVQPLPVTITEEQAWERALLAGLEPKS
jgi:hypothetical protein